MQSLLSFGAMLVHKIMLDHSQIKKGFEFFFTGVFCYYTERIRDLGIVLSVRQKPYFTHAHTLINLGSLDVKSLFWVIFLWSS